MQGWNLLGGRRYDYIHLCGYQTSVVGREARGGHTKQAKSSWFLEADAATYFVWAVVLCILLCLGPFIYMQEPAFVRPFAISWGDRGSET